MTLANPFYQFKSRWLFVIVAFLSILSAGVLEIASVGLNVKSEDPLLTYIFSIFFFGLFCGCLLLLFKPYQVQPKFLIGTTPKHYNWLFLLVLAIFLILFSLGSALTSYAAIYAFFPEWMDDFLQSIAAQEESVSRFPMTSDIIEVIVLIIVAPITEEFIFRGVLLHRWVTKWGLWTGIILSSLLFGIGHVNPVGLTMVGVVLCVLYFKTNSLLIPIIAHALNNSTVVLLRFISESSTLAESEQSVQEMFTDWQSGLVLIVVSAPFLFYYLYKNFPSLGSPLPYLANQANN